MDTGRRGRPRIAVSACLLGERVRHDGGHKRNAHVVGTLAREFELVPICPEVGIGLGVPRAPIRLVRYGDALRVCGVTEPDLDVTDALTAYTHAQAGVLATVCGYVFKQSSPSCGVARVQVHDAAGRPAGHAAGVYARAVRAALPLLPVEEESGLADPRRRARFVLCAGTYARWRICVAGGPTPAALAAFHARHRLLVLARSAAACRRLDALTLKLGAAPPSGRAQDYLGILMATLSRPATERGHERVLRHLARRVGETLGARARAVLAHRIGAYAAGRLPRTAVVALLRRHLRRRPGLCPEAALYLASRPGAPPAAML